MSKALVAGTGISGIGSAKLLLQKGYDVTIFDENLSCDKDEVIEKIGTQNSLSVYVGKLNSEVAAGAEFCVMSPGINPNAEFCKLLSKLDIPYISEVELAYKYEKGRLAAITGTNGKTTTTALLGQIFSDTGRKTFVAGNIGAAYTESVVKTDEDSISVIEIAGHQLQTIDTFRPNVATILNISPDHMDRFGTMENYINAKKRIAENQTPDDTIVLNYDDEELRNFAGEVRSNVLYFSSRRALEKGAFIRDDEIIIKLDKEETLCNFEDMILLGTHNYENIMAAALMALAMGVDIEDIRKTVKTFKPVEHRIEFVDEINTVKFYNDSKGTNPEASTRAIMAMISPTVLIAGGYDKKVSFDKWAGALGERVRKLIIIGECKERMAEAAKGQGYMNYCFANSLEEAFDEAIKAAFEGDAILLSPACASWDMFKSYEERGNRFKKLVKEYGERESQKN